ncbi:MAG: right-handed parallel beta-helix repeat-containing protein [Planctomycetota bacterium]|jgi:parallel beta-helix repeat protein
MKRFLLIGVLLLPGSGVRAETLNVGPGGYATIQAAIDDANDRDIIVVSPATYRENIDFLGKAVTVQSVNPDDPYVVASTIIDGWYHADPNRGSVVTFRNGEDSDSVLSGFTITGGTGSWLLVSWEYKGLYWNRCGGGVVCYNMSAPTISKNFFVNNVAAQGGGIYVYGDPVNPDDPSNPAHHIKPVIVDNVLINNSAILDHGYAPPDSNYPDGDHGDGGAIAAFQGCDPVVTGNVVESSYAYTYGAGIHLRQWCNGIIEDNWIIGNRSLLGAGVHITYTSSPTVRDNLIKSNIAGNWGGAGVYVIARSHPVIERNVIIENESAVGAGIGVFSSSRPLIRNNFIVKNRKGSGIYIQQSDPKVFHNTIADNTAPTYGGGIECKLDCAPTIEHNVITSNGVGFGINLDSGSSAVMRYNNVWNHGAGNYGQDIPDQTGINGNISVEPGFVNPDGNDYHLSYNSGCVSSGDPNFSGPAMTDVDGQPRVMGPLLDLGADEAQRVWNISSGTEYDGIQEAIDDANDFDTIIATEDVYYENINLRGKAVTLRSTDPYDWNVVKNTVIDGNNSAENQGTVVTCKSGENADTVLAGFTITGGYRDMYDAEAGFGGGIKVHEYSSPTILRNLITGNHGWRGAGMSLYHSSSLVQDNIFVNNRSTQYGYGGGISIIDAEAPVLVNNIIVGNDARTAAGIMLIHSHATIINNTIAFNRGSSGRAGGLYIESFDDILTNCIIWGNGDDIWQAVEASPVTYSCIEDGDANEGNISVDPNFVDEGYWHDANTPGDLTDDFFVYGNYHIMPDSPCVDAGDNKSAPLLPETDFDGEQRLFGGAVDMGMDEAVTNPFDLNGDAIVDYYELAILTEEWLQSGDQLRTDFSGDGLVNFADLSLLAGQWLWTAGWYR